MSSSSVQLTSLNGNDTIATAVQFLDDVHDKHYDEGSLRRYLIEKRKLTNVQVDQVFRIYNNRGREKSTKIHIHSSEMWPSSSSERPERIVGIKKKKNTPNGWLVDCSKGSAGYKLVGDFVNSEKRYCDLLECLWTGYYMKLSEMAFGRKFRMSQKKTEEMFQTIPHFLNFHTTFYKDLKAGEDIGRMFVRLLHFFKKYPEYMKSLTVTIKQLGTYAGDTVFQKCLKQIRRDSKFQPHDLVGLMLVPLDRMMEYQVFLDQLVALANKTQSSCEYLNKAARRIGRISSYIKKYRSVINNMHEIYRVQIYLAGQVDIFADKRRLIRRGMIIRRTEGWTARNKQYVFFLFNDILLWTTKKGAFQNVVPLVKCEVLPWEARNNSKHKLKLIAREDRVKTLWLECKSQRQRNDWYGSLERAIVDSHKLLYEEVIELPALLAYEDSDEEEEKAKHASVLNNNKKTAMVKTVDKIARNSGSRSSLNFGSRGSLNLSPRSNLMAIAENEGENKKHDSDSEDFAYDYECSQNYSTYEFKGFDPFNDTASQISESDLRFYEENSRYKKIRDGTTAGSLSPFRNDSRGQMSNSGSMHELTYNSSGSMINTANSPSHGDNIEKNRSRTDVSHYISKSPRFVRKSGIIRRSDGDEAEVPVSPVGSPSVTISLSNFV